MFHMSSTLFRFQNVLGCARLHRTTLLQMFNHSISYRLHCSRILVNTTSSGPPDRLVEAPGQHFRKASPSEDSLLQIPDIPGSVPCRQEKANGTQTFPPVKQDLHWRTSTSNYSGIIDHSKPSCSILWRCGLSHHCTCAHGQEAVSKSLNRLSSQCEHSANT